MTNLELEKRSPSAYPEKREEEVHVYRPNTDIVVSDEETVIMMDMPGVDEQKVNIVLDRDLLTIRGRSSLAAPDGCRLVREEFPAGEFHREFEITDEFDSGAIKASLKDGLLTIKLPKGETAKPKKIPVGTE